ncbi:E2.4.1.214 [Lepeophtheirus salmonis]|uniref:Fucosyltransferase n=1 Tax=Lepeophtheirus salmonis TaxID=72036 RepID=A0A7R8CK23_LEPSM|nr:E2.4.1.214 [Lepeophtheirus salmonis]CAF2846450.1 E2.4.1.214 [Lepeophtheirus salmonis]
MEFSTEMKKKLLELSGLSNMKDLEKFMETPGVFNEKTFEKVWDLFLQDYSDVQNYYEECKDESRSIQKSVNLRTKGNEAYKKKCLETSINLYSDSIKAIPPSEDGSEPLALSFANRSAAFYEIKSFSQSLNDVEAAFHGGKVSENLLKAMDDFDNCSNEDEFLGKSLEEYLGQNLNSSVNLSNSQFPALRRGLKVEFDEIKGRHCITETEIPAGELVLCEDPIVSYLHPSFNDKKLLCLLITSLEKTEHSTFICQLRQFNVTTQLYSKTKWTSLLKTDYMFVDHPKERNLDEECKIYARTVLAIRLLRESEILAQEFTQTLLFLNHSCNPNTYRFHQGKRVFLYSKRKIYPGEELTDCYGMHHLSMPYEERQSNLCTGYCFNCQCDACTFKYPLFHELKQQNQNETEPKVLKEKLSRIKSLFEEKLYLEAADVSRSLLTGLYESKEQQSMKPYISAEHVGLVFCYCQWIYLKDDILDKSLSKNDGKSLLVEASGNNKRYNILFWNEYFSYSYFGMGLYNEGFLKNKCQFTNCYNSNIQSKWKSGKFDAIVFHGLQESMNVKDIAMLKKAREAKRTFHIPFLKTFLILFVPFSFGTKVSTPKMNKTKGIAWVVSHCKTESKREEYVNELRKHLKKLTIDIYGTCGDHSIQKDQSQQNDVQSVEWGRLNMYKNILKDYKFYISFENAKCKDYITEKFFYALSIPNVIPITFGTNISDYEYVAPKKSFIHVDEFDSPKELATYLEDLNENDEKFFAYQTWRSLFFVDVPNFSSPCEFCRVLNQRSLQNKPPIPDINKYWFTNQCNN